ncbi:hypothetical protein Mal15_28830 [Stieleria maiorica]|uniref:Bacterial Ig-like domain (Group 2) n=1 Tax=Stieleria maiorica TaxID=2795974 RepID=A0A5B9MF79_9BACT|nr:DUF1549 and DUF1553 domain-containing protein [Stieleria maiorica]QEF98826.1 hypothetical protein Mal15_28830 [Stieleria maiorica]
MFRTLALPLLATIVSTLPVGRLLAEQVPPVGAVPEFTTDVMPVLSKAGCNLGTCHGNLNGKGGLKLSLRGQDPQYDYQRLVRAAKGRRVNVAAPELSLFLQKASGGVPHGGGTRFTTDSPAYQLLTRWLRSGANGPSSEAPTLVRLEVQPEQAIVSDPERELPIHVSATFSDGTTRDVTDTACYELSNLHATVDAHGVVSRHRYGETTLIVRYLQLQRPVPIAFIESRPDFVWSDPDPHNEIDRHVFAKLQRLRINPSVVCDDTVFVRRAYLDAIGRIPTADEARAFVADSTADKRDRLVDRLLALPEFADFWALKWADVLRAEEKVLDTQGVNVFHSWIRDSIAAGRPLDQFVRELVTGTGSTFNQPSANYYRANRDPSTRGETTARLFLGTRLQCAKCHNHPFDRWTQDDYYQWSALFSQIDYEIGENKRQDKLDKNEFAGDQTVLVAKMDEVRNPTTDQLAPPTFLGGDRLGESALKDRLAATAEWLTARENKLFVQSQTNFIWYQLMGLGLVDPIDDFRLTNPPSNPPLMQWLASHFADSGFDVRSLVGTIMKSRTYQLSSEPNETNRNDNTCYSRAYVRRLPAEVILDMQSDVLDSPASFLGYPAGIRAVQIPGVQSKLARRNSPEAGDRFLKTFGKPDRILACDCERSDETTLKQVFVLIGEGLNDRLASPNNRIARLAMSKRTDAEVVDELYWAALSRAPTEAEQAAALRMINGPNRNPASSWKDVVRAVVANPSGDKRADALQDIAWALMNAKEFLFRK